MDHDISALACEPSPRQPLGPAPPHIERDPDRSLAEQRWENEGGQLSGFSNVSSGQMTSLGLHAPEIESLSAEILLMARTLYDDLANGRIGKRYNTFEHRSRVLRQLTSKRDTLRQGGE